MDDQDYQELLELFYSVTNKMFKMRNTPMSFEGTEPLNMAALHMIEMIGKRPDYNLTQMARALGVTKGAVSQMAQKLEQKDLIRKVEWGDNEKNVYFLLTDEGKRVYEGHERFHREMRTKMKDRLSEFRQEDLNRLKQVIATLNDYLTEYGHV